MLSVWFQKKRFFIITLILILLEDKQQLPKWIFMGNCFEGNHWDKEWLEK